MANRQLQQFQLSFEKQLVHIFASVTFGSSGAPTLNAAASKGVKSITRNSTGDYTIVLQDTYNQLMNVKHVFNNASAPAAPAMYLKASGTNVSSLSSPQIEMVMNSGGTATDPASGENLLIHIVTKNSSAF